MCALQRVCFSDEAGVLTTRAAGECSHRRIRRQSRHPSRRADFSAPSSRKRRQSALLARWGGTEHSNGREGGRGERTTTRRVSQPAIAHYSHRQDGAWLLGRA